MDEDEFTELAESVSGVGESTAADLYETFADADAFESDETAETDTSELEDALAIVGDDRKSRTFRLATAEQALERAVGTEGEN